MTRPITESTRTARKPHRCDLCTAAIHPGEQYHLGTYAGDCIYDWKTCRGCEADSITNRVWRWGAMTWDEGVGPEDAHEWANDQAGHGAPDDARAARAFLERWNHG